MSLKSDTTALDGKPKRDWANPRLKRNITLKPLPSWLKPVPEGQIVEGPVSKEVREFVLRECFKGAEDIINRSPYDATPLPLVPKLFGGNPVFLLEITDQNRPLLGQLSQLALEYYNNNKEGSSASFQFHDLVKSTIWTDIPRHPFPKPGPRRPTVYYITFQAKAKGDTTSSSPAITTFRAKVLLDVDQIQPPIVEECRIHTPPCESCP